MISLVKIPLGNILMFRNQNTFAFRCHLIQCLTLKATAVPVCLEIGQFGSGRKRHVLVLSACEHASALRFLHKSLNKPLY